MTVVTLSPVGLSFLLLAAHFYRAHNLVLAGLAVALLAVLWLRQPWAARLAQAALLLGALEWLRTLLMLVAERSAMGQAYLRLALILGAVAVLTAAAAWLFRLPRVRAHFNSLGLVHGEAVHPDDNPRREARQTVAGAILETEHWRNVRTAKGSVAANGCPLKGRKVIR